MTEPSVPPPPRPLRRLGRALVALVGLLLVADAAALVTELLRMQALGREGLPAGDLARVDDRATAMGLLQGCVALACIVPWLVWFRRAYADLPLLGNGYARRFGKGWAIGAWFVPILNLWRPKQIANEIWRATEPDSGVPLKDRRVPRLLAAWWALWVISLYGGTAATSVSDPIETTQDSAAWVAYDLVALPLDVLAIMVVLAITRRWEARRRACLADT